MLRKPSPTAIIENLGKTDPSIKVTSSIFSYINVRIYAISRIASQLAFTFAPIAAYLPQYLSILKSMRSIPYSSTTKNLNPSHPTEIQASQQGLSPISVLILIMAHLLRLIYFWGSWVLQHTIQVVDGEMLPAPPAPLKVDVIGQSIVMLSIQLMILHAMVSRRRMMNKRRMEEDEFRNNTTRRFSIHNFWKWDSFQIHLEFLFTTAAFLFLLCRIRMDRYGLSALDIFGQTSVGLESALALPQILLNYNQKSTAGLSFVMIFGWVVGDSLKFMYFQLSNEEKNPDEVDSVNQMFLWGSISALMMDVIVFFQMVYLYPNEDVVKVKEFLRKLFTYNKDSKIQYRVCIGNKRHECVPPK